MIDTITQKEIEELIVNGERLVEEASISGSELGHESVQTLTSVTVRCGQMIDRLYGPNGRYGTMLQSILGTKDFTRIHSNHYAHVAQIVGILKAVKHDMDSGLLVDFRRLVQAELFSDFLEMAEYLANQGYKDASAVLLGAILENALRKISEVRGLDISNANGKPLSMETMNVQLAKDGAYNALVKKQITSWSNLRNDAAHGRYEEYDSGQVNQMLLFVQKFCADFLS